jgi:hypothetical protein
MQPTACPAAHLALSDIRQLPGVPEPFLHVGDLSLIPASFPGLYPSSVETVRFTFDAGPGSKSKIWQAAGQVTFRAPIRGGQIVVGRQHELSDPLAREIPLLVIACRRLTIQPVKA